MGERLDRGRRYANAGRAATKVEGNYKPFYNWERPAAAKLSGKSRLLVTFLQEILANSEKVLNFSASTWKLLIACGNKQKNWARRRLSTTADLDKTPARILQLNFRMMRRRG